MLLRSVLSPRSCHFRGTKRAEGTTFEDNSVRRVDERVEGANLVEIKITPKRMTEEEKYYSGDKEREILDTERLS